VLAQAPLLNARRSFLDARTREAVAAFYHEPNKRLQDDAGIALSSAYP
jgi:hypothetical protein